jgi:hypothetical protein
MKPCQGSKVGAWTTLTKSSFGRNHPRVLLIFEYKPIIGLYEVDVGLR